MKQNSKTLTGQYCDQLNDSGTLSLLGGTLLILPYNNFIPTVGDEFVVLTWRTGLVGSFSTINIDAHFTSHGITLTPVITNPTGSGNLTLRAVATAVPEVGAFAAVGAVAIFAVGVAAVRRTGLFLIMKRR